MSANINVHRVVSIEVTHKWRITSTGLCLKGLTITDEDGGIFEVSLFSDSSENLVIKDDISWELLE